MYKVPHVKCQLLLLDFHENLIFPKDFRKILKYQITRKFVQRKPSISMWTDGRWGMTKLIVALRNFANAPKTPAVYLKRTKWADYIWIYPVQHSADGSNWKRRTATFTVTHWTLCSNITHCCIIMWVFSSVSKAPQSFETSTNSHQSTRC